MPIAVKDYTWDQTDRLVFITLPLKGIKLEASDIFCTEKYLKISFPPYFFECLFFEPINDESSSTHIQDGRAIIKLEKKQSIRWSTLQSPFQDDKIRMKSIREAEYSWYKEKIENLTRIKSEHKRKAQKYAVNEQMKRDKNIRQYQETVKKNEAKTALESLGLTKKDDVKVSEKENEPSANAKFDNDTTLEKEKKISPLNGKRKSRVNQSKLDTDKTIFSGDEINVAAKDNESTKEIPSIRKSGDISISFTHRDFPTAARESTHDEEQNWLKKQVEAKRIAKLEDENLSEHERNPVWLRDKGNSFFQKGEFQAAVNCYTHGIRMSPSFPSLFSNRSACHLRMGNYMKTVEDASRALELMEPKVIQNASARCKAHVRRGTAFAYLKLYVEALQDYEVAFKLDGSNEKLKSDIEKLRKIIEGSIPEPDTTRIADVKFEAALVENKNDSEKSVKNDDCIEILQRNENMLKNDTGDVAYDNGQEESGKKSGEIDENCNDTIEKDGNNIGDVKVSTDVNNIQMRDENEYNNDYFSDVD